MRTFVIYLLLSSCAVFLSYNARAARIVTFPIYINSPDSSVHAHVMNNSDACKANQDLRYHWYSKNTILSTDGGFSGRLLHGSYTSFYSNNNLKSKGEFSKGLKNGTWISWYTNGGIRERTVYKNGVLHGTQELFDSTGFLRMRIYYRNGARAGKTTIFSQNNSDSVIRYKKGHVVKNDSTKRQKADVQRADTITKKDVATSDTTTSHPSRKRLKKGDSLSNTKPGKENRAKKVRKEEEKPADNKSPEKKWRIREIFQRKTKP